MADLFDALAARAMGTEVPLLPAPASRFAAPTQDPRLVVTSSEDVAETSTPGRTDVRTVAERPASARPDPTALRRETDPVTWRRELVPRDAEPARNVPDPGRRLDAELVSQDDPAPAAAPVAQAPDDRPGRRRTALLEAPAAPDQVADPAAASGPRTLPEPATGRDARTKAPNYLSPTAELVTELDDVASREASESPTRTPTPIEVTVHIGSVVVRYAPVPAAASPRPPARLPRPRMSLQEYLRQDARR